MPETFGYITDISYSGMFILLLLTNLFPMPEELLLLLFGYIAATGFGNIYLVALVSLISLTLGDNVLFILARRGSKYVERFERHLMQEKFDKYKEKMHEHIGKTIFITRFISGFRLLGPFLSGASESITWARFQFFNLLALLVYVPALVFGGYIFHTEVIAVVIKIEALRHVFFVGFLIILGILSKIFISNKMYRISSGGGQEDESKIV